jgi:hypothetical protein
LRLFGLIILALPLLSVFAYAQEAASGVDIPVVVSGAATFVRNSGGNDTSSQARAGFRATAAPSLRLGSHWFAYSLVDAYSSSYSDYSYGDDNSPVDVELLQAYLGYKRNFKNVSILIKAGRLASAFGSYPLQYNDAKTALIDPPSSYFEEFPIRTDQRACGVDDLVNQSYAESLQFHCGGSKAEGYGVVPVTLYGIPGVETQLSWKRIDARMQMTNSSPANPQSLLSSSQTAQWTTGGGYSFQGGLRVGFSQFRGSYLEDTLASVLPSGKRFRDYKASGTGVDFQWSRASWSIEGEWQRFQFNLPGFTQSPSQQTAYFQLKRILSPRLYLAARTSLERPGGVADVSGDASRQFAADAETQELVFGYWINRLQLLKAGVRYTTQNAWSYEDDASPSRREFAIELQLVTSLNPFSKRF